MDKGVICNEFLGLGLVIFVQRSIMLFKHHLLFIRMPCA